MQQVSCKLPRSRKLYPGRLDAEAQSAQARTVSNGRSQIYYLEAAATVASTSVEPARLQLDFLGMCSCSYGEIMILPVLLDAG